MLDKATVYVPMIIIAFTVLSHALAFAAQVLDDLHKDKPGFLDTASSACAKVLAFLNGMKV